jgi:hypothetical protein
MRQAVNRLALRKPGILTKTGRSGAITAGLPSAPAIPCRLTR